MSLNSQHYLVGLLTAVKNTAIAMTVTSAYENEADAVEGTDSEMMVTARYFDHHNVLQIVQLNADDFIGFGDYLIFENGQFVAAGYNEDEDTDEDDTDTDDDSPGGADLDDEPDAFDDEPDDANLKPIA